MNYVDKVLNRARIIYNLKLKYSFESCVNLAVDIEIPINELVDLARIFGITRNDIVKAVIDKNRKEGI